MATYSVLRIAYPCFSRYFTKDTSLKYCMYINKNVSYYRRLLHCQRCASHTSFREYSTLDEKISDPTAPKKKKTPIIPKITLFDPDGKMSVITYEEAQNISKRRDLKLIKISDADSKSGRATFKLLTPAQFLEVSKKKKTTKESSGFKGEKTINLATKIEENDLKVKTNNIVKWVSKNYEVKVVITGDSSDMSGAEKVYSFITSQLKNKERVVQKRTKGSTLKFQVLPPKGEKGTESAKIQEQEEMQEENVSSDDEKDNEEEDENKSQRKR